MTALGGGLYPMPGRKHWRPARVYCTLSQMEEAGLGVVVFAVPCTVTRESSE